MERKKIVEADDGLTTFAVAVGSALGKLAQKVGLGEAAVVRKNLVRSRGTDTSRRVTCYFSVTSRP